MTSTIPMNAADYLKYLVEAAGHLLDGARDNLTNIEQHCDADEFDDQLDSVCDLIWSAQREIVEAAAAFSADGDDLATYSDGTAVNLTCEIEPGCYFTFTCHPFPDHRDNRPRDICTLDCRDGIKRRVVLQPGRNLVAVPVEPLRAVVDTNHDDRTPFDGDL